MNEYLDPEDEQDNKQQEKEKNNNKNSSARSGKKSIETRGPAKNKKFKVLHEDGSFADLPDKEGKGSGALDGTVGRGM